MTEPTCCGGGGGARFKSVRQACQARDAGARHTCSSRIKYDGSKEGVRGPRGRSSAPHWGTAASTQLWSQKLGKTKAGSAERHFDLERKDSSKDVDVSRVLGVNASANGTCR
jgi:hypothetical protein